MKAVVLEKRGKDGIRIGDFPDPERAPGNAIEALARMGNAEQFGKIVLTIP